MYQVDPAIVQTFLQSNFDSRVEGVASIGTGMFSRAFAFAIDQREFVVRVSQCLEDFQKDAFAREHFASPTLPIPRIVRTGRIDDIQYFCITERCAGKTLTEQETNRLVAPHLFEALDAIHCIDVSQSSGWGLAYANGEGRFDSWVNYLAALYNQKFDYAWAGFKHLPFWDQGLFDEFYKEMKRLLMYCPSHRNLYHGDFGFGNVVTDGTRITGVLDWAEFGYGDYLYDVASLDFFSQNIPYGTLWYEHTLAQGRAEPNFDERMRCYMLYTGLHDMANAATHRRERTYIRGRERTKSVLLPARRAPTDWTQ